MIALALLLLLGTPEDTARLAAQHFAEGVASFSRGDFTAAALAFERAYGVAPRAAALLNAAEAWERAGQRAQAVRDCERALEDSSITSEQAGEARRRIARIEPKIARLEVTGPEGWSVELDGSGVRRGVPVTIPVEPGQRLVAIRDASGAEREPRVQVFEAGRAERIALEERAKEPTPVEPAVIEPAPAEPAGPLVASAPDAGAGEGGPPLPSWIAFGASGAALVATAVLGGVTLGAQSSYQRAPTQEGADAFYADRAATNVTLGLAVAGAACGLVLWALD